MNTLEARHISKSYAQHKALDDVSIAVKQGTVFGLLGPNGAGKTSLIRIINQITGPDSGEVLFNGQKLEPIHREFIGYLPEHYARQWVGPGEMRALMSPETRILSPFVIMTNKDIPSSPLQKLFIRELVVQGSLAREGRRPAKKGAVKSKKSM